MKKIVLLMVVFISLLLSSSRDIVLSQKYSHSKKQAQIVNKLGNYYAILIGVQNYKHIRKLRTPINDIEDLAKVLKEKYGFRKVILVKDPTNRDDL